jgi:hypothetical protein
MLQVRPRIVGVYLCEAALRNGWLRVIVYSKRREDYVLVSTN